MNAPLQTTVATEQYLKVLADGTRVASSDSRTDHVAVLDTTRNLLFCAHSIGIGGKRARDARDLKPVVEALDLLGGGWRIADVDEAASIIRRDRHSPAVDLNLFPGIKPEWHITSTPAAWAPASRAWWVGFYYGGVCVDLVVSVGWALAVRPAGQ
jgi:hypothetical protein